MRTLFESPSGDFDDTSQESATALLDEIDDSYRQMSESFILAGTCVEDDAPESALEPLEIDTAAEPAASPSHSTPPPPQHPAVLELSFTRQQVHLFTHDVVRLAEKTDGSKRAPLYMYNTTAEIRSMQGRNKVRQVAGFARLTRSHGRGANIRLTDFMGKASEMLDDDASLTTAHSYVNVLEQHPRVFMGPRIIASMTGALSKTAQCMDVMEEYGVTLDTTSAHSMCEALERLKARIRGRMTNYDRQKVLWKARLDTQALAQHAGAATISSVRTICLERTGATHAKPKRQAERVGSAVELI